jgi:hypothetical protein
MSATKCTSEEAYEVSSDDFDFVELNESEAESLLSGKRTFATL